MVSVNKPIYLPLCVNLSFSGTEMCNFTPTPQTELNFSSIHAYNTTATGYNVTITIIENGNGAINVTFISNLNGIVVI